MAKKLEPEEKERRKQARKDQRAGTLTAAPEKTTPKVVIEKGIYCVYCAKTQDLENGLCPDCGRPV